MKDITFVVGAGASADFGLPTGKSLLEKISIIVDVNFSVMFPGIISSVAQIGRQANLVFTLTGLSHSLRDRFAECGEAVQDGPTDLDEPARVCRRLFRGC